MRNLLLLSALIILSSQIYAQDIPETEAEIEKQYAIDIRKTHLAGIYIPANVEEAFQEIQALTEGDALKKFAQAPIEQVAPKLHFGIGRWMMVNWKFESGSRLSHLLKEKDLKSPDAMSQYMIYALHAHLNAVELDEKAVVELVNKKHEEQVKKMREGDQLIKSETRKIEEKGKN